MTTIAEKLTLLVNTKQEIKAAIVGKGVEIDDEPFSQYPSKINEIGDKYIRPSDWLELPEVLESEQKIVGLHAIFDGDANFVAFTISGAYTVDWGDGSALEDFAIGATAYHNFNYNDFDDNSLSSRGYRQAIITIIPQAGENFTNVNFQVKHNQAGLVNGYAMGWLDINISANQVSIFAFGGSTVVPYFIERFNWVGQNLVDNFTNCFINSYILQSVQIYTGNATNLTSFFRTCQTLAIAPELDLSNATNLTSFFSGCTNLKHIPVYNTSNVTNFSSFASLCYSLGVFPNLNTSNAINITSMFDFNFSLKEVGALNFSNVTTFTNAFRSCSSLGRIKATGMKESFSIASGMLSATALNEIYTNLPTIVGKTITVTGNFGTSGDDPSIATAKGWTVTGS